MLWWSAWRVHGKTRAPQPDSRLRGNDVPAGAARAASRCLGRASHTPTRSRSEPPASLLCTPHPYATDPVSPSNTRFDTSHGGGRTTPLASSFATTDTIVRSPPHSGHERVATPFPVSPTASHRQLSPSPWSRALVTRRIKPGAPRAPAPDPLQCSPRSVGGGLVGTEIDGIAGLLESSRNFRGLHGAGMVATGGIEPPTSRL